MLSKILSRTLEIFKNYSHRFSSEPVPLKNRKLASEDYLIPILKWYTSSTTNTSRLQEVFVIVVSKHNIQNVSQHFIYFCSEKHLRISRYVSVLIWLKKNFFLRLHILFTIYSKRTISKYF